MTQLSSPSVSSATDATSRNDVFISYSRQDKAFVEILDRAFRQRNRDPWVDWDDIRKGEDWWKSIQKGIEEANTFIFVISPDSIASKVCRDEVEYATQCHKKFLPIVRREGFPIAQAHPSISRHNWLFFRETDDFDRSFQDLLKALDTDLNYVRSHTRLLVRALEWRKSKKDSSYLLRGSDLADAQQWLHKGFSKEPRPTELQASYITASYAAEELKQKARQKTRWIVVLVTLMANLTFVVGGLIWFTSILQEDPEEKLMQHWWNDALYHADANFPDHASDFEALATTEISNDPAELANNDLYQTHRGWLRTIEDLANGARPVTYYISESHQDKALIISDLARPTDAPHFPILKKGVRVNNELIDGFKGQVVIESGTEHGGAPIDDIVSVFGPIELQDGTPVGVLELRYRQENVQQYIASADSIGDDFIDRVAWVAPLVAFIWFSVSSWIILKATQPPKDD